MNYSQSQDCATTVQDLESKLPSILHPLIDLAFNYWWSWSPQGSKLFAELDSQHWSACQHNPVKFLRSLSTQRLTQATVDPLFRQRLEVLVEQFKSYQNQQNTWASDHYPQFTRSRPIAYFSIEFGIHQSLPIYAGGLGVLAGDHLKSASDLGIPMVGIGLLYRHGYFQQHLNTEAWQEEDYPDRDFSNLPITLLTDENKQPLRITVNIRDRCVKAQVWQVNIGRSTLYLLDSDCEENDSLDRSITACLYGGNSNTRIAQEILLGMGGVRLLQHLKLRPSVYHFNEGHSAFALLELIHQTLQATGQDFDTAKEIVKQRCLFTTHTPVMAGHDVFSLDLMDEYFSHYWPQLQLSREAFLDLGARRPQDPSEPFNMTVLALRLTHAANGVSQLNGQVCRRMWSVLYPDRAVDEVPIGAITNGVHVKSWIAPLFRDLYHRHLGDWETHLCDRDFWQQVQDIPDGELWQCHQLLKNRLVAFVRSRIAQARERRGEDSQSISASENLLDPNALTIGFARRFSAYKRPNLITSDPDRAFKLFANRDRPIQIIFAGKAHPHNQESKRILQRLMEWSHQAEIRDRVVFLEDYDLDTAKALVQGVDLWLNTPRPPLEASGTSGQKVSLNGGLNCSLLDGWWREAYQEGENGWAIGGYDFSDERRQQDEQDAASLYQLLEEEIIPLYYDERQENLPLEWIRRMKVAISTVAPFFNTDRMVADYLERYYLPSLQAEVAPALVDVTS